MKSSTSSSLIEQTSVGPLTEEFSMSKSNKLFELCLLLLFDSLVLLLFEPILGLKNNSELSSNSFSVAACSSIRF